MSAQKNKNYSLEIIRHSTSHILASAISQLYPGTQFGIGPAIENGFYYDISFPKDVKLTDNDLVLVKNKMQEIINSKLEFEHSSLEIDEAVRLFTDLKQPYKVELIKELVQDGNISVSIYKLGDYTDLCIGPHVENSSAIKAFELLSIAGAYWKSDEKNDMLTRIYGTAFGSQQDLDEYLEAQKKLKERDHRVLGQQLDLFCFSDLVGPGLPLFTPRGTAIKEALQKKIEGICYNKGFRKVMTPHIAKIGLYKLSGHADKYPEELFHVNCDRYQNYVMKPVQCPHQTQIFASRPRSYRELPIRYMESEKQYRAEKSGELSGLSRVLAITVEDGHSFCTVDQVKDEVKLMVEIVKEFYEALGLWGTNWVSLSVRDPKHPEKYIGDPEDWIICEQMLEDISEEMELNAKRCEGEAAVYGPKLDFMFKDALGRQIQIPTVQLDFATPKRFNLEYTNEKGEKQNPVMVHRAILGSYERLLVLLIEHFGGNFPYWLAPEQVRVLPVQAKHIDYAKEVLFQIEQCGVRVEGDYRDVSLSDKIKDARLYKVPYMIIVGDKEIENKTITIRGRDSGEQEKVSMDGIKEYFAKRE